MADPSSSADNDDFPEEDEGGGESTVSMTSPNIDPAMPLPISVPPPPMQGAGGGVQMPTAPVPFVPGGPAAFPIQGRPAPTSQPSVPTPFGGITPGGPPASQPRPVPAAGAPAIGVPGASAGAAPAGMKRPQTVIGLAPPPIGAPRPLPAGPCRPSGRNAGPAGAPRPAANAPASSPGEKGPPSSGRGVKPPALPASAAVPPSSAKPLAAKDADSTDEQPAMPEDVPDSQKEEMPTMAKSAEESLALFGLGAGLTDAARSAVGPKPPAPASGRSPIARPPVQVEPISPLTPDQHTAALPPQGVPAPLPAAGAPAELPVLHDRSEEEESTRAVSREEMLRGHDAVIIGEDGENAQGEDATLAVAPGLNEASSPQFAALAASLTSESPAEGAFPPPPFGQAPPPSQPGWQDPNANAYAQQQQPPMSAPQPPWQDPNAYQQQPGWNGPPSYPMSVGPVSGPHLPAANPFPQSSPQMQVPQSSPHLQVPQSGHMPVGYAQGQQGQQGQGPIPYPGPNIHQPPNPFGDWNAASAPKKKFVLSGQVLLLAIVGTVCLAIFITGIVLFATTKF
ncbi:MAG: hypothetical protein KIT84_29455 [Labilithrix sp.]|nr:hypothetical protein [Labilithrix sp.]